MPSRWHVVARVAAWALAPALLVGALVASATNDGLARSIAPLDLPVLAVIMACWLTGVVVTGQAPQQRAGWAFLGLGTAAAWGGLCDEYSDLGRLGEFDVPAWRLFAALGDSSWIWWFVFLALVLEYTPPIRRGLARRLPSVTLAAGIVFQVSALLRSTPLDPPRQALSSPLAVAALDRPARVVAAVALYTLPICMVAALGLLVREWRRSEGESRQQLLWLVAGATPLVPSVIAAFALSYADLEPWAAVVLGVAVVALVLGAGLSALRYRLYDVERVVITSAGYAIAAVGVLLAFVTVVVVLSRGGALDAASPPTVVAATLAGAGSARVSYVWGRRAVGRRVSPARFRAVEAVREQLAAPAADLDHLVRRTLGRRARVVYPASGDTWVTSDGRAVDAGDDGVDVRRRDVLVARLEFDPQESRREVVAAVAREAAAEMDNVALRAELARQVELIRASRARLATAHQEERRRIEQDLHDGAQQRLIALAMRLQSARLNGDATVLAGEADRAIEDLKQTVRELRDLSAGLQPAALAGGGLVAAVADLAARAPVVVSYDVAEERVAADIESAAWFVVAEAVTNVVKHSGADHVSVQIRRAPGLLRVEIRDGGCGGADPAGGGLQGLADRVNAVGGSLSIRGGDPRGTVVEAVFSCAS